MVVVVVGVGVGVYLSQLRSLWSFWLAVRVLVLFPVASLAL